VALEIDENAVKAYYQRSIAYLMTNLLEEARDDAKKANELDPANTVIRDHCQTVKNEMMKASKKQAEVYAKMFTGKGQEQDQD